MPETAEAKGLKRKLPGIKRKIEEVLKELISFLKKSNNQIENRRKFGITAQAIRKRKIKTLRKHEREEKVNKNSIKKMN